MKYTINLIHEKRRTEQTGERYRLVVSILSLCSFGLLALAIAIAVFQILDMNIAVYHERSLFARVKKEYDGYRTNRLSVNKADLELLDSLWNDRISWSKKLGALFSHLPNSYEITQFSYEPPLFKASGVVYLTPEQERLLITVDGYLKLLRMDTTYNDVFHETNLNSLVVTREKHQRSRVDFVFSSINERENRGMNNGGKF